MWLLGFLILPLALAAAEERSINGYRVKIEDGTLRRVQSSPEASNVLDLSNLGLKDVGEGLFANLPNLEHLNLANNDIKQLRKAFAGLDALKTLNITNNPLSTLERGSLNGVPQSTDIFFTRDSLESISTAAFENPLEPVVTTTTISVAEAHRGIFKYNPKIHGPSKYFPGGETTTEPAPTGLSRDLRVQACVEGGKLKELSKLEKNEAPKQNCKEVKIDFDNNKIILSGLGISSFNDGGYNLQSQPVAAIDLSDNNVSELTKAILNYLPESVKEVSLSKNKISQVPNGVVENNHIEKLDLSHNQISSIGNEAFRKMDHLENLNLDNNQLTDTAFAAALPRGLKQLSAVHNEVSEITEVSFVGLDKLGTLNLAFNRITTIKKNSLQGLTGLRLLLLSDNSIDKLEKESFKHQTFIRSLDLDGNQLTAIEKDTFSGLGILLGIKLNRNKISVLNRQTLAGLHPVLHYVELGQNGIEILNTDSIVGVPFLDLSLKGNKISKIVKGGIKVRSLRSLLLDDNKLEHIDGDSFEGLENLQTLSLARNGIKRIEKGAAKNLGSLSLLNLSGNPIEELKKGALFGLSKTMDQTVEVKGAPIELIQGGLFDDA